MVITLLPSAAVGINRIDRIQAIAVLLRLAKTDDRELARLVFVDSDPLVVVRAMAGLPQAGKRPDVQDQCAGRNEIALVIMVRAGADMGRLGRRQRRTGSGEVEERDLGARWRYRPRTGESAS